MKKHGEKERRNREELAKRGPAVDYLKYMIGNRLPPSDSAVAPLFEQKFGELSKVDLKAIKTKLVRGIQDNRDNQ